MNLFTTIHFKSNDFGLNTLKKNPSNQLHMFYPKNENNKNHNFLVPSKDVNFNTHKYIVKNAINLLINDVTKENKRNRFLIRKIEDFFNKNTSNLLSGCISPDMTELDFNCGVPTFQGHFFDPDTNKNFLGNIKPTAYTRFIDHSLQAKRLYEQGDKSFSKELGMALHYLADAGEPHHSSNKIAFLSNHINYEKYSKLIKIKCKVSCGSLYNSFQPKNIDDDKKFEDYCKRLLVYTSRFSKKYSSISEINIDYNINKTDNKEMIEVNMKNISDSDFYKLNNSVIDNINNCQDVTAAYLYNFIRAIKMIQ